MYIYIFKHREGSYKYNKHTPYHIRSTTPFDNTKLKALILHNTYILLSKNFTD